MNGLLAVLIVVVPLVAAIAFVFAGLAHGWARWPWLAGAGFALVPAWYLTFQSACRHIGGTCPPAAQLRASHWAVVGLVLLAGGMALAVSGRSRPGACLLIGLGEAWMVWRLGVAGQTFAAEVVGLLLAAGVALEAAAALRGRSRSRRAELR